MRRTDRIELLLKKYVGVTGGIKDRGGKARAMTEKRPSSIDSVYRGPRECSLWTRRTMRVVKKHGGKLLRVV